MIVVTTGVPGAGKTLYALTWVKAKAEKENRPVYYSGIKDLKLPWMEHAPEKWEELPANSIMVIDECQRVFRPRMHGSAVPSFVAALETHRHKGIDLVLITQHPMLIDQNVRRLCGLHFHVVRKWGMQAATVHEWPTIKETCDKNRADSVRHEFAYPKSNYGLYHSAEVHTHKARIPYHVWIIALVPFVVGYAGWRIYSNWFPQAKAGPAVEEKAPDARTLAAEGGRATRSSDKSTTMGPEEYVASFTPRVAGLAYTAPAYDDVTKPVEAPYPAAAVLMGKTCRAYTQQGTRLEVPDELCRQIVAGGFFVPWKQQTPPAIPARTLESDLEAGPVLISLGGQTVAAGKLITQDKAGPGRN